MSPWKVILATMVIFVCGVVTGVLVIRAQDSHPVAAVSSPSGMPGPAPVMGFIRRLGPLDLTTNQHDDIVKIMQDSQATNAAIRKTIAPLLTKEMERAYDAIDKVLNPDQRVKFAELRKEREKEAGERGRGGRGGDGIGFRRNPTNRFGTNGFPMDDHGRGNHGNAPGNVDATNNSRTNGP